MGDLSAFEPVHRAMIEMLCQRRTREQWHAIEDMSYDEVADELVQEFREEPIRIPARTKPAKCWTCGAVVYWVTSRHARQYKEPVSIAGEDCEAPTGSTAGEGFSHRADCPGSLYREHRHLALVNT